MSTMACGPAFRTTPERGILDDALMEIAIFFEDGDFRSTVPLVRIADRLERAAQEILFVQGKEGQEPRPYQLHPEHHVAAAHCGLGLLPAPPEAIYSQLAEDLRRFIQAPMYSEGVRLGRVLDLAHWLTKGSEFTPLPEVAFGQYADWVGNWLRIYN